MKKLIFLFLVTLSMLTSCGADISEVKNDMSQDEVTELMGKPNKKNEQKSSQTINGETTETSTATWTYEGAGTIEFVDGKVVEVAKN